MASRGKFQGGPRRLLLEDPGRRRMLAFLVAALSAPLGGCATHIVLDKAVLDYDTTTAESIAKQLLLNVARVRQDEPIHFTEIASIAATYKLTMSAGVSGALTGNRGSLLIPLVGTSAEENPTVSITPMQGEEFTQRLLTPFPEQKLTLLLRQGYDVDALLRLMAAELRIEDPATGKIDVYTNRPGDKEGYAMFRRILSQLSTIQDRNDLHVEPLHFQYTWQVPAADVTPESFASTYKDFNLTLDDQGKTYRVARRVNGRVMIANFDPDFLSNEERARLHEEAEEAPTNDILVEIRAGFPGGEIPLHGRLRLRSFHEILSFIGRGIAEEPEFDVPPDPRTPAMAENPAHALDIAEADHPDPRAWLSVELHGHCYFVRPQDGYQWNNKAFSLLYQLFQMSVSTAAPAGPEITISK